MKKSLYVSSIVLLVLASFSYMAQSATGEKAVNDTRIVTARSSSSANLVSVSLQKKFREDFGPVTEVRWELGKPFTKAVFTRNGRTMKAYYNAGSKLVAAASAASFDELPQAAQEQLRTQYNDYAVVSVFAFEKSVSGYSHRTGLEGNYLVELNSYGKSLLVKVNKAGETNQL
ncbi:MAG: hypothetical protein LWW85_09735 [Marinilabiliales bacterium]|nr:hypothetical protein [Marinilabiliales bacterium]